MASKIYPTSPTKGNTPHSLKQPQRMCGSKRAQDPQRHPVQLLDMAAVCARLSIAPATGWRWLKTGVLPSPTVKRGRITRWSAAAIEKFASEGVKV